MTKYEQILDHAILKILEGSPRTRHRRDEMDNVKARKIAQNIFSIKVAGTTIRELIEKAILLSDEE